MGFRSAFLAGFVCGTAFASELTDTCNQLLQARVIARGRQPAYSIELDSAGEIIRPGEKIGVLKSGFYVFLISRAGEILLSPKYDVQKFPRGLATHKSLIHMYEMQTARSIESEVVAAGEFQIAFVEVTEIRNASQIYPNDGENLHLAAAVLIERGLPIHERTRFSVAEAASEENSAVLQDQTRLQNLHAVHRLASGPQLILLFERFFALIRATFPEGRAKDAIEQALVLRKMGMAQTREFVGQSSFIYPLITAFTSDGLEFGILAVERQHRSVNGDPQSFGRVVPIQINNILVGAGAKFSMETRAKWFQLSRAFSALIKN